jgi:hypothetical protein
MYNFGKYKKKNFIAFRVLLEVVMKDTIFCEVMLCIALDGHDVSDTFTIPNFSVAVEASNKMETEIVCSLKTSAIYQSARRHIPYHIT